MIFIDCLLALFFEHSRPGKKLLKSSGAAAEDAKRDKYIRERRWYSGAHHDCCPKCFQAGYVVALVRANRLDLLTEHPQLISVYEELARDGMLEAAFAKTRSYYAQAPAGRTSTR